jgi:hypothetical protein
LETHVINLPHDPLRPLDGSSELEHVPPVDLIHETFRAGRAESLERNRWQSFMAFLKHFGIKGVVTRHDTPGFVEQEAEAYSQAEMQKFLAACTDEQRLLYSFYLKTGFRMQEVMYLSSR